MKRRWQVYDITGRVYALLAGLPQRPYVRIDDLARLFAAAHPTLTVTLGYPLSHGPKRTTRRTLARYLQDGLRGVDMNGRGIEMDLLLDPASGQLTPIYRAGGDLYGDL